MEFLFNATSGNLKREDEKRMELKFMNEATVTVKYVNEWKRRNELRSVRNDLGS